MAPSRRRGSSKASSAAAAAAKRNWKVGDLVLAKVKGFPAWPATVSEPEKWGYSTDWKKVLVHFFGTKQIAFCNPADVEAFTEEKKKSLLSKRHGKGADFVRAVQEIVDCFEKSQEHELVDEVNSGDGCTISNAGNMEDSMGKSGNKSQMQSPMAIPNSRSESLCVSSDNNDSHHLIEVHAEMQNDGFHDMDMDTVSQEQFENASSPDHLRETTLVVSDSLRKRLIDAPLQSSVMQKRTAPRRSRSTVKVEICKHESQASLVNDRSTNVGIVLPNGTKNESAKRSKRIRKSRGNSVWHHMESPGYCAAFTSNISSEDNGSDIGATNSDTISFNCGSTLESSRKSGHPSIIVEVLDRGVQLSERFQLPADTFVFKKKRKPNRKRVACGADAPAASPNKSPGLDIRVEKTIPHSPNFCENLPDRVSRANGDEHLPLNKRARVRMGKPPSEEKQLNELVDAEEDSSKEVSMNNSHPLLSSFKCGTDFYDASVSSVTNGYTNMEKEPIWNASKYQLRGSVDGEAALPPSKRLHRALEAMSANAAEEGQTFIDAQGTTKVISFNGCSDSTDNISSHISADNEVGSASDYQKLSSSGDSDADMNGETELVPVLASPTSEVLAKASADPNSCGKLLQYPNTSRSVDCKEMEIEFTNSVEVKHVDDSSLNTHSDETKASIKNPHTSSSHGQKQGVLGSRREAMDLSPHSVKKEKYEILGSRPESSNGTIKVEHTYFQEDKSTLEQSTSQSNHLEQDYSEINEAGVCSPGGDGAHLSVVNGDSCNNMQSLMSPLDKNVPAMFEGLNEVKYKPAEKDIDANSMKVLIAAAQAKRQLSLSSSLSDNVVDDKFVCDSVSSPTSVSRVCSYEQVSPPTSTNCHLSKVDNKNHPLHNGSVDILPQCKKSTRLLETEEVGNLASSSSHKQKKWTKAEANAVRKSFESMLGTLSRTKESIGRATRLAIDCAKYGMANEVLDILVRNLEAESSLRKRVDLFFLVDSITQCSRGQKGDIGDIYPSAVRAILPRLLSAVAPPGNDARENRKQCLKVLRLWLERKTLPESLIRHHMRELDSTETLFTTIHSRRPLRMERALNDPIREMEGMHVDEYGSNASFQLPGFCMPRMLEDEEGSDAEERSFEAVTPEQDSEFPVEREATPTSAFEKHCHILEDVDGELEMEDVAPSYEMEKRSGSDITAVDNVDTSHNQFKQHLPLLFGPPLPEACPPSPPPLPVSPPPAVPPPPPLPSQSVICHPFTDSADLKFQTNAHNIQIPSQQHMSQQSDTPSSNSVMSDTVQYYAPGYRDMGKQSVRPGSFCSSSSFCNAPVPHPSVRREHNDNHIDGGSRHKSYHLQPPPPMLSNQFSYVHADQRRQSWTEASSSSFPKRLRFGFDMDREDIYEKRGRMESTPREVGERCRIAAPVRSVQVQSDIPEAYTHISRYGPVEESTRILDRGWSFPPRTLNYHNPTHFRPPEAPNFWRPR